VDETTGPYKTTHMAELLWSTPGWAIRPHAQRAALARADAGPWCDWCAGFVWPERKGGTRLPGNCPGAPWPLGWGSPVCYRPAPETQED